jgi:glycosyltransferase involved in cell wall biosynthesis
MRRIARNAGLSVTWLRPADNDTAYLPNGLNSETTLALRTAGDVVCAPDAMRVAIVCDFAEERWRAMDMVGDMLAEHLRKSLGLHVVQVRPPFSRRATRLPVLGRQWLARSTDRFVNRFMDYPRWTRRNRGRFDVFHVVDHSYSQLIHGLPANRTIVTCHDLDTFRCLIEPEREPRSLPFRIMVRRILDGFRKAAIVVCDSRTVHDEILFYQLLPEGRLVVIPPGVHPTCSENSDPSAKAEVERLLGPTFSNVPIVLHVGSTAPRKRLDLLLRIFAAVRARVPELRLIRVGGEFTRAQRQLAQELSVLNAIAVMPFIRKDLLAALYRRASVLLLTSEREGFGLPLIEAMACGTPVVASDLPVLREVGGGMPTYCRVGDTCAWSDAVVRLLAERCERPASWQRRREAGIAHASAFSWDAYAERVVALYREILRHQAQFVT